MTDDADDADDLDARSVRKRARRDAGDRSAKLANTLLKVPPSVLGKLELDDELRAAVDRARAVTAHIARRRAERALAGELRRVDDLAALERRLANVQDTGAAEPRLFHAAEQWRARLIAEGLAAAASFPGGAAEPLPTLIANAQRERDLGAPRGAARALFRHVMAALSAAARDA